MLLPYQIHSNSSLQWWMRMYFFTSHDFWQPKFQLITHSVLEKWSVDISVAGWIQSSQLFTRTKRVWLVQVEITKGVVYYTVMRFVRPEKNCQIWRWHRCLHCLHSLHYVYCFLYLGKPTWEKSAVFFNIVQKAFDPPLWPLWTSCGELFKKRFWALKMVVIIPIFKMLYKCRF